MIKPITKRLIEAISMDWIPDYATCCDFGIESDDPNPQFGALQWAFRNECVTAEELDDALGNGHKLTEIVSRTNNTGQVNPYKCKVRTFWDDFKDI